MAEKLQTWAGSTVQEPVMEQIETPVVEQPKEIQDLDTPETVIEPVDRPETDVITEPTEPVEAPVVEEPVVDVVPETVEVPETPVEPKVVETPVEPTKVPETKVETAQDVKAQNITNETNQNQLDETKRTQVNEEMQRMIQGGASEDEILSFANKNSQFADDIKTTLRNTFKNTANLRYFSKYSTMNNEDMYAAYQKGKVVPGSDEYNLLPSEKKRAFDNYLAEQNALNVIDKTDYTSSNNVMDMSSLESQMPKMFSSTVRESYQKSLNNPRIQELSAELAQNQADIDDIDDQLNDLRDNLEAEAWTSTVAQFNAKYRQAQKSLLDEKRLLLRERGLQLWEYQSLKSNAETELKIAMYEDGIARDQYTTQLNLYETRRQEKRADISAAEKADIERQNAIFEAENKKIAETTKFQRDIALLEYKAMLSDEWVTWEWQERDDGTYFLKSDWTATKVLDAAVTPWIRTNTVFEDWQAYTEVYDINNQWIWFTSKNTALKASERELLNAPNWTRIPTRLWKDQLSPNNPWGKECWEYVNDIMARTVGQRIGSLWEEKLKYANESEWEIWSVVVWKVNPNVEDKYGHTWIIVWETEDWESWIVKSSNIKWQWIVSTWTLPKTAASWYRTTDTILTEEAFWEFNQSSIPQFKNYLKTWKIGASTSELESIEKEFWNIAQFKKQAEAYNNSKWWPRQKEIKKIVEISDKLRSVLSSDNSEALSNSVGTVQFALTPWNRREKENFLWEVQNLLDGLTLQTLIDAKADGATFGALSNEELKMLQNTASELNQIAERDDENNITWFRWSEENFKKKVQKMIDAYEKTINEKEALFWEETIFTDDDGKRYSKQQIEDYIVNKIESWAWTNEDARFFLTTNNLTDKLK